MPATPPNPVPKAPLWMSAILWLAAVYNILAGAAGLATPEAIFEQAGMPMPEHVEFFQALTAAAVVFGIGYGLAATNVYRHWPLVLLGLIGKLGIPAVFAAPVIQGTLSRRFGWMIGISDLAWCLPFALILIGAWRAYHPREAGPAKAAEGAPETAAAAEPRAPGASAGTDAYLAAESAALGAVTRAATLHRGHMLSALSLRELSDKTPTLLVFLRHQGCTFCREALADIAAQRKLIESKGVAIVLVHMSPPNKAAKFFDRFGLIDPDPIWHTSDPARKLYQAFELPRARLSRLIGLRDIARASKAAILKGHFIGLPVGDTRQLGGAVLFYKRQVLAAFRPERASDRPGYQDVAACPVPMEPAPVIKAPAREARSVR